MGRVHGDSSLESQVELTGGLNLTNGRGCYP